MADFLYKWRLTLLFLLLLLLIYFPLFLHLDYMTIRQWDESIMGVNAIEMGHNHNYIVTSFGGNPDMLNCKPPLQIWGILLFSKIFGFNELSLRLTSAIAGLVLCIYLFFMLRRITGSAVFGFITVLVLVTSQGYIRAHVARTGEYDSLLVLFSTVAAFSMFNAIEAEDKKKASKNLLLFFVFLTLAALTKGVAPLMQVPGLFIYALIRKKVWPFLKNPALYIGLSVFLLFVVGYYFLRETMNPGYLHAVWINELGGRFASANEGHVGIFMNYWNEMVAWTFVNYYLFLPLALIIGLRFSENPVKRLVLFSLVTGFAFWLVVSSAQTKLSHYDAPLFPYLAVIIAALLYFIYTAIRSFLNNKLSTIGAGALALCGVLTLISVQYQDVLGAVYFEKGDSWDEGFTSQCRIFQMAVRGKIPAKNYKIVFNSLHTYMPGAVLECYQQELIDAGLSNKIVQYKDVAAGDTVILFNDTDWQELGKTYSLKTVFHLQDHFVDVGNLVYVAPRPVGQDTIN